MARVQSDTRLNDITLTEVSDAFSTSTLITINYVYTSTHASGRHTPLLWRNPSQLCMEYQFQVVAIAEAEGWVRDQCSAASS